MKSVSNWISYLQGFSRIFPHYLDIFVRDTEFWFILNGKSSVERGPPVGLYVDAHRIPIGWPARCPLAVFLPIIKASPFRPTWSERASPPCQ
jgi:hypothetical protein